MSQNPRAWLLKDSAGDPFAVSEIEMVAYEQAPRSYSVPCTPDYCPALTLWQERLLPLFHYPRLFGQDTTARVAHVGILAYQPRPGQPLDYVAVSLQGSPHKIVVKEDAIAQLPPAYDDPLLRPLALSCFEHEGQAVPILDIAYLASATLRDALSRSAY